MVDDAEFKLVQKTVEELEHMIKGNGSKGIHRVVIESSLKLDDLIKDMSGLVKEVSESKNKRESRLWEITKLMLPFAAAGAMLYFLKAQ
jgi:hypothetical protein